MTNTTNNAPDITKTAFSCPHCSAYAAQKWGRLYSRNYYEHIQTPTIPDENQIKELEENNFIDIEEKQKIIESIKSGKPFHNPYKLNDGILIENVNVSKCDNCNEFCIWVRDKIAWPKTRINIEPNSDLSPEIRSLFNEAREIATASPKGAAALLRLCVQHLCKDLGETGKNIDSDIANLVAKGLNPMIQQALDIVRVIGNESVHPGEIDLNDNPEISIKLFHLINLIADQMITQPKNVQDLFQSLPKNKIEGIEQRNKRATQQKK
jgi:hypothetical protein